MHRPRGFTLIELLVVISIISLLTSIVLASLNSARNKAKLGAALQFSTQFHHGLGAYAAGLWPFQEGAGSTVADLSGNGGTGTFQGTPTWSTDTPNGRGNSLSFDGTSAHILGSMPSNAFSGDFTITAWFKRNAASTWAAIFSNSVGTNDTAIMTMRNATTQFGIMRVGVSEAEGVYIDLGTATDAQWVFGVVQRQGNTLRVMAYKDGKLISNSGPLTWTLLSTNQYYIGRHYSGGLYFNGLIDEVGVYSDALTFAQIDKMYAEGAKKLLVAYCGIKS